MDPTAPKFTANYASEMKVPSGIKNLLTLLFFFMVAMVFWVWISSPIIVTVSGVGEVTVPATNAVITFSVNANDASAQNAVNAVKAKAESMRLFLTQKGIADSDIAEGQVTAVPASLVAPGTGGYQAEIQMAAKTIHVADVPNLVSDLYTNGVKVVSQPILSVEGEDSLQEEALERAMKDAKREAGRIGFKNWKFIRKIIAISQSTTSNTSTATTKADTLSETSSVVAAENGVFKIVRVVSLSYKMW